MNPRSIKHFVYSEADLTTFLQYLIDNAQIADEDEETDIHFIEFSLRYKLRYRTKYKVKYKFITVALYDGIKLYIIICKSKNESLKLIT